MEFEVIASELRQLNERVPKPLTLPSEEQVVAAEQAIGGAFDPEFRRYLLELSDVVFGSIEPVTLAGPESHTHLHRVASHAWSDWGVPRDLMPICHDNADFYCVSKEGKVVFWSHDTRGLTGEEWPSVSAWIKAVWIEETQAL